ncbi:MAG TPA: PAS domain S-box protein [Usitatibacter sp.]|nr:PAS domain S-box protein [Usitatibacter sp.]
MPYTHKKEGGPTIWPDPRVRALQIDELYRFAPAAAGFSYFGALLTLAVLINTGDTGRGAVWFLWATAVTFFRFLTMVAYRRREAGSDPQHWARLMVVANLLAGLQWGILGSLLFPDTASYRQLFTVMVITCLIGGSVTAYAAVKGAHEALAIPATIPMAITLFFIQDGIHFMAGLTAMSFCFGLVYYARKLNRHLTQGYRMQIERGDLLTLSRMLNEKLEGENRELAHRAAVRAASVETTRERAERLEALFERSPLAQIECDSTGKLIACNAAAQRLFGLSQDGLVGRALASLMSAPAGAAGSLAGAPRAAVFEVEVPQRASAPLRCTASFTPLPEIEGRHPGFGVILSGCAAAAVLKPGQTTT